MELRDYVRMLRRGWPAIILITALFAGLGSLYVLLTPRRYESTTVLFVSANSPDNISDLQTGSQFSVNAVATYGEIVTSPTVLTPAAAALRPQGDVNEMAQSVWMVVPPDTTLINVTASANDAERAADMANAVADSATKVLPSLVTNAQGRPLARVQQIQPAVAPDHAISPNVKQILTLALIVGLCFGLATTIVAQALDTRIRRVDDVRRLTDIPLLAVVPPWKRGRHAGLAVRDEPIGTTGEVFRTLRTNLGFMESRDRRSLVFAAVADRRDGAQVPANLAWSLAQVGWRVLLVDLDLRRSNVGEILGMRPGPGLADVLLGHAGLKQVTRETAEPRLRVILSGTRQASPSDLLSTPVMNNLLRQMEREYDYVILHAPALLSYTDAALVARAAGGTMLTISAGRTRGQELTTALAALANVRIKPLGFVLTRERRIDGLLGLVGGGVRKSAVPAAAGSTLQYTPAPPAARPAPPLNGGRSGVANGAGPLAVPGGPPLPMRNGTSVPAGANPPFPAPNGPLLMPPPRDGSSPPAANVVSYPNDGDRVSTDDSPEPAQNGFSATERDESPMTTQDDPPAETDVEPTNTVDEPRKTVTDDSPAPARAGAANGSHEPS